MFRPVDLNPCHQLRSQIPIPLRYMYRYSAMYIDIYGFIIDKRYIPIIQYD